MPSTRLWIWCVLVVLGVLLRRRVYRLRSSSTFDQTAVAAPMTSPGDSRSHWDSTPTRWSGTPTSEQPLSHSFVSVGALDASGRMRTTGDPLEQVKLPILVPPPGKSPRSKRGLVKCSCCYCGATNYVAQPPCLHLCDKCHHEFRVYLASVGTRPMELTETAQRHYHPDTDYVAPQEPA